MKRKWWQRRCTGTLRGPEIIGAPTWRCRLPRKHTGTLCSFEPDDWPELQELGGWRNLKNLRLR